MFQLQPFALLITLAAGAAVNPHPWIAPGAGDVRSPCPGLNTLSNHGYLPRNGKGLTIPLLNEALLAGFNVGNDFSTVIGSAGLLSSPNPLGGSFNLDNLDKHNFPIEHDASLSRQDFFPSGDDHSFNQATWNQVLAYVNNSDTFTIPIGAKARFNRVQTQSRIDPTFQYSAREFVLSYGETALYLSVMGDPITGVAPVKYVRTFFEQERLPYEEGWTKPQVMTTLNTLGNMILLLNVATGEPVPEGLILGASTLKLAFSGRNPVT